MTQLSLQPSSPPPSTSQPTSPNSTSRLLPVPTPLTNNSVLFAYPDSEEAGSSISAGLPPDIAGADISLAPDGSFVETSSGKAAHELKKRFDLHYGVSTTVRSPYAITAYNNQYGKKMYRIGRRDMAPPGASAANAVDQMSYRTSSSAISASPPHPSTSSVGRQTRLSFNLLRPSGTTPSSYYIAPSGRAKNKGKLRKPRSNPDLQSLDGAALRASGTSPTEKGKASAVGRTHSLSVTAIDAFGGPYVYHNGVSSTLSPPRATQPHIKSKKGDMFGEIMQWDHAAGSSGSHRVRNNSNASSMFGSSSQFGGSPSQFGSVSSSSSASASSPAGEFGQITTTTMATPERQRSGSVSRSATMILRPFGANVMFEPRWQAPQSRSQSRRTPQVPPLPSHPVPPMPPSRSEERRRKSQSWSVEHESSTHTDAGFDAFGYASDGGLDLDIGQDGEREGKEELELWKAYFDTLGTPSSSKRATGPVKNDEHDQQHEEEEETDFQRYLKAPPQRNLKAMQSFESGLTARQVAGPSRGVNNAGNEEWSPVAEGDEDEDDTRVLRRAPSAIRMRPDTEPQAVNTETKVAQEKAAGVEPASHPLPDSPLTSSVNVPESTPVLDDTSSSLSGPEPIQRGSEDFAHTPQPTQIRHQTPPLPLESAQDLPTQPLPSTSLLTRFSTDVFDVLQTYRGLPLLDKLQEAKERKRGRDRGKKYPADSVLKESDEADAGADTEEGGYEKDSSSNESEDDAWSDRLTMLETTVIRLSLEDDESAAPRNDPRFVIWGDVINPSSAVDGESSVDVDVGSTSARSSIDLGSEDSGKRSRGTSLSRKKARSLVKVPKKDKDKEARSRSGSGTASATSTSIPAPPDIILPSSTHEPSMTLTSQALTLNSVGGLGIEKKKQLLAATIERWIAQVTSELDYDELLLFFMTYRTYISPLDLAHLLIARFHWALTAPCAAESTSQPTASGSLHTQAQDIERAERVKRVVRLRTFVAWRYWLITFFSVDFRPNPELRMLVSTWLNTLVRDPIIGRWDDAMSLVKKLRKVVKECKKVHSPSTIKSKNKSSKANSHHRSSQSQTPTAQTSKTSSGSGSAGNGTPTGKEHLLGEKFAEATRQLSQAKKRAQEEEESDVDLDLPDYDEPSSSSASAGLPLSTLSILQRTDHAPGPDSPTLARGGGSGGVGLGSYRGEFIESPATLPIHSNSLSKVFVKTIGRLGRWKRVLSDRRPSTISSKPVADTGGIGAMGGPTGVGGAYAPSNAFGLGFEVTLNKERELLEVNGGLKEYLRVIEGQQQERVNMSGSPSNQNRASNFTGRREDTTASVLHASGAPNRASVAPSSANTAANISEEYVEDLDTATQPSEPDEADSESRTETASIDGDLSERSSIARTSSTDSFGVPLSATRGSAMFPAFRAPYGFDVVSIDELSDSSSENEAEPALPPGLRRQPRKLPTRRVMEVDDRGTVSSMGIVSTDSYASTRSSTSEASGGEGAGLGRNIQQWQINALVDSLTDDEEAGDVEDALRRLEGQINPQKKHEKANKVEGWVRTIRQKLAAGDYDEDERPRWLDSDSSESDDPDDYDIHAGPSLAGNSAMVETDTIPSISQPQPEGNGSSVVESLSMPVITNSNLLASPPRPTSDARPAPEDAVPLEILQSRLSSEISAVPSSRPSVSVKPKTDTPRLHRSFILGFKAEELAQQFAMIDRELIVKVSFDELLTGDWMNCEDIDVLDWNQFQKDRARWKAESRWPERTGALGNIRGRFNLVANFTVSEIVQTHPSERSSVFAKLLHIAWRSYEKNCFTTVVAIITGLQNKYVTNAMRRNMGRISSYDHRRFRDLKIFIANDNNFRYLNDAVEKLMDSKSADVNTQSVSNNSTMEAPNKNKAETSNPPACIPFIGTYLSQLYQHSQLPDLIDPTAPDEAVNIDPLTSNLDSPAHPEIFSALAPLPPSMHLEPLVNVHKQRLIAGVVQSFLAAQHLASRVRFSVHDKRLYKQCLELKGLDLETLQSTLQSLPG
ncbi:group protein [Moniliophthora roreri]|nr:group protein [Moniliophthora roreri]